MEPTPVRSKLFHCVGGVAEVRKTSPLDPEKGFLHSSEELKG